MDIDSLTKTDDISKTIENRVKFAKNRQNFNLEKLSKEVQVKLALFGFTEECVSTF